MITALDDRESKLRGIEIGADDYITKPFDRMELRLRIKTITKLNRYRHNLEEKKKIEKLIEFSPYGILVIDKEHLIVLQNKKIQELLGLPGEEALMNKTFLSYLHLEEQDNFLQILEEVKQGIKPKAKLESLLLNSNGFFLPVEMELAKFPTASEEGVQISIRDITYEKNMCSKLTILQKAVDQSSMMIMVLDLDWRLTYVNPEILRKTGFTEKEMIQNKFQVFYEPDLNTTALESIKKLRKEKKEWRGEMKCRKKSGEILIEKTSIYPIKDFSGHCTHFVKIAEEK
jgi:PAS domain S-box-containing protein